MANAIEVYIDISKPVARIVKGLRDSANFAPLDSYLQYSGIPLKVFIVVPTGTTSQPPYFSKVPLNGLGVQAYLGPRIGAEALLASQPVFTAVTAPDADGISGYFSATINLNTTAINTALVSDFLSTYLEFHLSRDGTYSPVAQLPVTIIAAVKDPSGAAALPTPVVNYWTSDQMQAWAESLFVKWRNDLDPRNAGRNVVFSSPGALAEREIGVADDGSPIDNAS